MKPSTRPYSSPLPVIGLTGAIGSGKSEVAKILQSKGAIIIDADLLAREVTTPGSPALDEIVRAFGTTSIDDRGQLRRRELGQIVFSDPEKRQILESIIHPRVRELFKARLAAAHHEGPQKGASAIVYVVPLLFESGYSFDELGYIVVVSAAERTLLARTQQRDNCSEAEAVQRYRAQLPIAEKVKRADFVVENDGDLDQLALKTTAVFDTIIATHHRRRQREEQQDT